MEISKLENEVARLNTKGDEDGKTNQSAGGSHREAWSLERRQERM